VGEMRKICKNYAIIVGREEIGVRARKKSLSKIEAGPRFEEKGGSSVLILNC